MKAIDVIMAIGDVNSGFVQEAEQCWERAEIYRLKYLHNKKTLLIAAILSLILLLAGCAAVFYQMSRLAIGNYNPPDAVTEPTQGVGIGISLQGYLGSKNYEASKAWYDFKQNYDRDYQILLSPEAEKTYPEEYMYYGCYSADMVKKVDEICGAYDLKKAGRLLTNVPKEILFEALQMDEILREIEGMTASYFHGYFCETGLFDISFDVTLPGVSDAEPYKANVRLRCTPKDVFDNVFLVIWNLEEIVEREYTNQDNEHLLLAIGEKYAYIFSDQPDYFISVQVTYPCLNSDNIPIQITRDALEEIADALNFKATPTPVTNAAFQKAKGDVEKGFFTN